MWVPKVPDALMSASTRIQTRSDTGGYGRAADTRCWHSPDLPWWLRGCRAESERNSPQVGARLASLSCSEFSVSCSWPALRPRHCIAQGGADPPPWLQLQVPGGGIAWSAVAAVRGYGQCKSGRNSPQVGAPRLSQGLHCFPDPDTSENTRG